MIGLLLLFFFFFFFCLFHFFPFSFSLLLLFSFFIQNNLSSLLQSSITAKKIPGFRSLDKRGYLMITDDNFSYFSFKPNVVTPHLKIRGHNISFEVELTKLIPNYHQILPLI